MQKCSVLLGVSLSWWWHRVGEQICQKHSADEVKGLQTRAGLGWLLWWVWVIPSLPGLAIHLSISRPRLASYLEIRLWEECSVKLFLVVYLSLLEILLAVMVIENLQPVTCPFKVVPLLPTSHSDGQDLIILFHWRELMEKKKPQRFRTCSGPHYCESTVPIAVLEASISTTKVKAGSGWASTGAEVKTCVRNLKACWALKNQ